MMDIIEAIDNVERMLEGVDLESLRSDRVRRMAYERFLEIISEASRHVPDHVKSSAPGIPWRRVADIGNHLRHGYNRIDLVTIWSIHDDGLLRQLRETIAEAAERLPKTP